MPSRRQLQQARSPPCKSKQSPDSPAKNYHKGSTNAWSFIPYGFLPEISEGETSRKTCPCTEILAAGPSPSHDGAYLRHKYLNNYPTPNPKHSKPKPFGPNASPTGRAQSNLGKLFLDAVARGLSLPLDFLTASLAKLRLTLQVPTIEGPRGSRTIYSRYLVD